MERHHAFQLLIDWCGGGGTIYNLCEMDCFQYLASTAYRVTTLNLPDTTRRLQ